MKAKSSHSGIMVSTAAKGTIALFSVAAFFIVGFVVWSVAGVGGAIVEFFKHM